MTQQHPITPPPELTDEQVGEWLIDDGYPWDLSEQAVITITSNRLKNVARQAAQWGADQELEACCAFAADQSWGLVNGPQVADVIRTARRPKPPSLKELALEDLEILIADLANHGMGFKATNIRRALEQLND